MGADKALRKRETKYQELGPCILLCREVLWLSDGGHLCLDWYNEGGGEQPTVLMLPGITGAQEEDVYNEFTW